MTIPEYLKSSPQETKKNKALLQGLVEGGKQMTAEDYREQKITFILGSVKGNVDRKYVEDVVDKFM